MIYLFCVLLKKFCMSLYCIVLLFLFLRGGAMLFDIGQSASVQHSLEAIGLTTRFEYKRLWKLSGDCCWTMPTCLHRKDLLSWSRVDFVYPWHSAWCIIIKQSSVAFLWRWFILALLTISLCQIRPSLVSIFFILNFFLCFNSLTWIFLTS